MKSKTESYHDFNEIWDESKADIASYIEKRLALTKLRVYEKLASSFSFIIYGLVLAAFVLILFSLLLIGSGLLLGEVLHNYAAGFGILILFILFCLLIVIFNRKKMRRLFINTTLSIIKQIESDED